MQWKWISNECGCMLRRGCLDHDISAIKAERDKLAAENAEFRTAIAKQAHNQPDGSAWCDWEEGRYFRDCTVENCIWMNAVRSLGVKL
jgi:hypothetical protein